MEEIEGLDFLFILNFGRSNFAHTAPSAWIQAAFAHCGVERSAGCKKIALWHFVLSVRHVWWDSREQHLPRDTSP